MTHKTKKILFMVTMAVLLVGGILPRYIGDSQDYRTGIASIIFLLGALLVFILWHFYFQYKGLPPEELEGRKAVYAEWRRKYLFLFFAQRFIVIAFFTVAFAILAGVVFISFIGARERAAMDEQSKAADTSNWQTYRNDEFGFEVKYPKSWSNTTSEERNTIYDEDGNPIELKHYEFSNKKDGLFGDDAWVASFQIDIGSDFNLFKELRDLKPGETSDQLPGIVYEKIEDFTIGSFSAVRYRGDYSAIPAGVLPRTDEVLLQRGEHIFHFMLILLGSAEAIKENEKFFDQILSTLRFVDSLSKKETPYYSGLGHIKFKPVFNAQDVQGFVETLKLKLNGENQALPIVYFSLADKNSPMPINDLEAAFDVLEDDPYKAKCELNPKRDALGNIVTYGGNCVVVSHIT